MIKKIILIYFLFVSAVFSQQLFISDEYGFEITFPAYLVVNKGTTENPAVIAHINEYTLLNVVLQSDAGLSGKKMDYYNLDSFITPMKEMLLKDMIGFKLINYDRININGTGAIYFAYDYYKGMNEVRVKQYFMINNSKMYAITTMCPESEAGDFEIVFNDCVNSFKFLK